MIVPTQVTVGTSPTLLAVVPRGTITTVLTNAGTAPVAVGLNDLVTTSTGALIPPGAVVPLISQGGSDGESLYAVVASGTAAVGVFLSQ